jgi:hypothetical protein
VVNYCQSCRRYLNGAVSCPGCGAAGVTAPETQDSRSTATDWKTEAAWPERDPLPTVESHGAVGTRERAHRNAANAGPHSATRIEGLAGPVAGGGSHARARAGEGSHAVPRPPLHGDDKSDRRKPIGPSASAEDVHVANGRRSRGAPRKRRGLGLRATITGGFAGIAIVGLLVLGNLPPAGGGAPVGATAAVPTSAQQSPGSISSPGMPAPAPTGSGEEAVANSNTATTSASPGSSTTSLPPSLSATPNHSATSTQAEQPTGPSTASSGTQSSQPATQTQSTTPPPAPKASPSPSQTQGNCFLIICW